VRRPFWAIAQSSSPRSPGSAGRGLTAASALVRADPAPPREPARVPHCRPQRGSRDIGADDARAHRQRAALLLDRGALRSRPPPTSLHHSVRRSLPRRDAPSRGQAVVAQGRPEAATAYLRRAPRRPPEVRIAEVRRVARRDAHGRRGRR
jgi:hypothetical protein